MTRKRQELNLTVVTTGDLVPEYVVLEALREAGVTVESSFVETDVEELPEPNKKRLVALAAWAAGEDAKRRLGLPNEWIQGSYFTRLDEKGEVDWDGTTRGCGTACCLAGKVVLEDGGVADFEGTRSYSTALFRMPDGKSSNTADVYAAQALGLTDDQATELFAGSNDLDDVLRMVAALVGTEPVED